MPHTFVLGIDGLPCSMWRRLASTGVMPFSASLIESGQLVPMQSSIPEVSSSAWASIVTGRNPGGHNVYGFTDLMDNSYALGFTSSRTFKAAPFWQQWSDGPHLIMNVPQTYPAQPLAGTLVSGFVALDLKRAVYPESRLAEFEAMNYRVDADMSTIEVSRDRFLAGINEVLTTRCEALHSLWDQDAWQAIMFVITGTDRLNHYLWEDYEDPASPYHQHFLDFYSRVDAEIERIAERLDDGTTFTIVSDHGFARQDISVNVNRLLHDHGYLKLRDSARRSYLDIEPETKAFAMDPGRIYLHRQSRYPNGTMDEAEAAAVANSLESLFSTLEINGRRLVDRVVCGRDVHTGPYARRAPDLILMPAAGVALSGRIDISELVETTRINGKHTFEDATFFCRSANTVELPRTMRVEDVLGVLNQTRVMARAA